MIDDTQETILGIIAVVVGAALTIAALVTWRCRALRDRVMA